MGAFISAFGFGRNFIAVFGDFCAVLRFLTSPSSSNTNELSVPGHFMGLQLASQVATPLPLLNCFLCLPCSDGGLSIESGLQRFLSLADPLPHTEFEILVHSSK